MFPLAHWLVNLQFPPEPQAVLVQHLTSAGSLGQYPLWEIPPPEEQVEVEIQVPGVPPTEQGPLRAAWERPTVRRRLERMVNCILDVLMEGFAVLMILGEEGEKGFYVKPELEVFVWIMFLGG